MDARLLIDILLQHLAETTMERNALRERVKELEAKPEDST